ncbi:MAG: murein biosynthesis protein MurJ, partial [Desulfovibrionaceae bacterium]|nr:murein biosynthesis protein MurJ [Desulfovibrionaceae bacterium]
FALAAIPASFQESGRLTALFYAERLLEFPLGLIAASLGMAIVPLLAAKESAAGQGLPQKLSAAFSLALLITLPAAFGLAACAPPLVRLLLQHGAFDALAAEHTASVLCACAPVLPAYALSRPLLAACHALGLNRRLSAQAIFTLALSLAGGLICSRLLPGAAGPAAGICLGVWAQAILLWKTVRQRCPVRLNLPLAALSLAGSLGTFAAARTVCRMGEANGFPPLFCLAAAIITGMACYALFLVPAVRQLKNLLALLKKL